jgi:2-oxoglutarate dehydrogenase E2 component (dihydrolipoamide succinyltransferase)
MAVEIRVPAVGESVVEVGVGRWLKRERDTVAVGEPLVELETDKANQQITADVAGVLEQILQQEGATVKPGDVLGVIVAGNGAVAAPPAPTAAPANDQAAPSASAAPTAATTAEAEAEVRVSPLAQRVAEELGVDVAQVPPTGPGQRVTREDVEAYAQRVKQPSVPATAPTGGVSAPPAEAPVPIAPLGRPEKRQRLTRRRLTIARRLVEAQHTAAMLTTFNEVDLTAVMAIRQRRRESFKEAHGVGLGYMSFFTKAVVGALKAFPQLNSEIQGDELVLKEYFDIGIAIGDSEGLVVPVVRDAEKLSFAEIEQAISGYAKKAKDRALTIEDLQGGTFTITNGGVYGSLLSTPILNPPQVGILGMHKIQERPVAVNGEVVIRPLMYLALTYDHRVVDGREAVQFLVKIKELLEDPELLLLAG